VGEIIRINEAKGSPRRHKKILRTKINGKFNDVISAKLKKKN
jgi:hypothetical protein